MVVQVMVLAGVSSIEVRFLKMLTLMLKDEDIIFIEDIIDTGRTLLYLRDMFKVP